jgi:hypothetical protein
MYNTDAADKIDDAKTYIRDAIQKLSEALAPATPSNDALPPEYRDEVCQVFVSLIKLRDKL